jgi:hypothetical protein
VIKIPAITRIKQVRLFFVVAAAVARGVPTRRDVSILFPVHVETASFLMGVEFGRTAGRRGSFVIKPNNTLVLFYTVIIMPGK